MKPKRLFTPGPVEVPWQVLETMSRPLIHHRTEEFRAIFRRAAEGLQKVYKTKNPVLILTASGSGAMEAAVVNLTKPGEKVLVIICGKFSERWQDLGTSFGLDVVTIDVEWGHGVDPARVEEALNEHPDIAVVFVTHSETSTGVLQDIKSISKIAHDHGALIAVDGITSLCAHVVETDAWNLDAVVGGSQKGFMMPPGLSFLSLSQAAQKRIHQPHHNVQYFDLAKALKSHESGDTPWTPALTLVIALNQALDMILEEGLENVIRRHTRNAKAVRLAVKALGLKLFASIPCNATTAVVPKKGSADAIRKHMDDEFGLKIAGGQGELKGKILRLGHLGPYHETDMYMMIAAFDKTLSDLDMNPSPGVGVEALLHFFKEK